MFISLFFFTLVLVSASSDNENDGPPFSCEKYIEGKIEILYTVPDAEQLLDFCPYGKNYTECNIKEAMHYDSDDEERMKQLQSVKSLVYELCDEDSELHKTYVASKSCYRSLLDKVPVCLSVAEDLYQEFREFVPHLELGNDEETYDGEIVESYIQKRKPFCIKQSYKTACIGIEIMENCEPEAYDLFTEVLHRFGEMKGMCWPEENMNLRATFLDFLANEKKLEKIDIFTTLFDLRKK